MISEFWYKTPKGILLVRAHEAAIADDITG
jgi:hypothetical protein